MEEVMSREAALDEISRFMNEICVDLDGKIAEQEAENADLRAAEWTDKEGNPPPAEGKCSAAQTRDKLCALLQQGRITIEGDQVTLQLLKPKGSRKELVFSEPDGGALGTLKKKKEPSTSDLYPLAASMITGATPNVMNGLKLRDLEPALTITNAFLLRIV